MLIFGVLKFHVRFTMCDMRYAVWKYAKLSSILYYYAEQFNDLWEIFSHTQVINACAGEMGQKLNNIIILILYDF